MRAALKVAYIGTEYHGFQIQPEERTVEGELIRALEETKLIKDRKSARYNAAGRTDAGVHATGQVIAFDTDNPGLTTPRTINTHLPDDIWVWARAEVSNGFDARRSAVSREYRYILYSPGKDISKLRRASKILIGLNDFANFTVKESRDMNTKRVIEKIETRVEGSFIIIDITADSFTRGMVRKIVTALSNVADGFKSEDWLNDVLEPEDFEDEIEMAPPYGLILRNISYDSAVFVEDHYAIKRASDRFQDLFLWCSVMSRAIGDMRNSMR